MIIATLVQALVCALPLSGVERVNLADFGEAVRFTTSANGEVKAERLDRGIDGWDPWRGEDGQFMMGLQWDEPRDVRQVNIEFRHAIASRDEIHVQYQPVTAGAADGPWVTIGIAEWWAGDRDVSFLFARSDKDAPPTTGPITDYRRTRRIRFVLGRSERPAVRYLRAFAPEPTETGDFSFRFEGAQVKPPVLVNLNNAALVTDYDEEEGSRLGHLEGDGKLTIRYLAAGRQSPNASRVELRSAADESKKADFQPAAVIAAGAATVEGITITGRQLPQPATRPCTQASSP